MKQKPEFYNFARDKTTGERELFIDGDISEESWFDDSCTSKRFKAELFSGKGDITLWISSNGGDVFAASQIYTMLLDYQGAVTAKIYGMCVSAASVICMAGDEVLMSPVSQIMIHNPAADVCGEIADLERGIEMLGEIKESIINAYEIRTSLPRAKISKLMDSETPMNVHTAMALGFCDGVSEDEKKLPKPPQKQAETPQDQKKTNIKRQATVASCYARLNLLTGGKYYV